MKKSNRIRVRIHGVNLNRIYKIVKKNQIEIYNIFREDYKTIYFDILKNKLKKLVGILNNSCYTIAVVERYGFYRAGNFLLTKFGYLIGAFAFLICLFASSMLIWRVEVYGINRIELTQIMQILSDSGIRVGAFKFNAQTNSVKQILLEELSDISLVSIIQKGGTVIVNVKEKLTIDESNNNTKSHIIAVEDGVITEITVIQGTAMVKAGDSFKKGDILIAGSFRNINGSYSDCTANGIIKARVYYSHTEEFKSHQLVNKRTGKVQVNSDYFLFGWNFKRVYSEPVFENYETEISTKNVFHDNFFPLKVTFTKYFELQEVEVIREFEDFKQELLKTCHKTALAKIPYNTVIVNEFEEIEQTANGYRVSAFYEAEMTM